MCTGLIGNTSLQNGIQYIDKSLSALYRSKYASQIKRESICKNIALYSIHEMGRILRRGDTVIAFDGYLLDIIKKGNDLLDHLLDIFQKEGPTFPKSFRGSFQIAIIENYKKENQTFFLYTDHNASRPVFYGLGHDALFFGPQISSVSVHIENKQVFWPSVVQFLIGGYFFSGTTILEQVKLLCAGEYLCFKSNQLEVKNYYNYRIEIRDSRFDYRDAQRKLSKDLRKAILDSWYHADEPAILLSGGYDSRYIFHTIAEAVDDTSKLTTLTWGHQLSKDHSDSQIASMISKKFNTHHLMIEKKTENIIDEFEMAFPAQSGMTDSAFYHANELTICQELREKFGIKSFFRGEECFGWNRNVFNYQNALEILGMSFAKHVHEIQSWFCRNYRKKILNAFSLTLSEHLSKYAMNPNELKDTLYHQQRLTMALQPTNFFKYHFQEVYNPLVYPEILSTISHIPDKYRAHKKIFRKCLRNDFPMAMKMPFAKYNNLVNWDLEISRNENLQSFFDFNIENMPSEFNKDFFKKQLFALVSLKDNGFPNSWKKNLYTAIKGKLPNQFIQPIKDFKKLRPQIVRIKHSFLIIRAVVLSKWFSILNS
jgi:asparagine synthetase B (glutamine-hydrolysing)